MALGQMPTGRKTSTQTQTLTVTCGSTRHSASIDRGSPFCMRSGHSRIIGVLLADIILWLFPPGTPVSSTRKLISSSFHCLDMTLAVAEALNPNKPNQTKPSFYEPQWNSVRVVVHRNTRNQILFIRFTKWILKRVLLASDRTCEDNAILWSSQLCSYVSVRWGFIELVWWPKSKTSSSFWLRNQNFTTGFQGLEILHQFTIASV